MLTKKNIGKVQNLYGKDFKVHGPYLCKDGRYRVILYNLLTKKKKVRQYSKLLMEVNVGRLLLKGEEVDHIDNNPLNNEYSNLQILSSKEHRQKQALYKYGSKISINCAECGKQLLISKSRLFGKRKFCSNSCRSKFYGNQHTCESRY